MNFDGQDVSNMRDRNAQMKYLNPLRQSSIKLNAKLVAKHIP